MSGISGVRGVHIRGLDLPSDVGDFSTESSLQTLVNAPPGVLFAAESGASPAKGFSFGLFTSYKSPSSMKSSSIAVRSVSRSSEIVQNTINYLRD